MSVDVSFTKENIDIYLKELAKELFKPLLQWTMRFWL